VKRWQIVTHMVLSIISVVASSVQLSLAVAAAAWDVYDLDYFRCYYFVGPYRPGSRVDVRHSAHFRLSTFIFAGLNEMLVEAFGDYYLPCSYSIL